MQQTEMADVDTDSSIGPDEIFETVSNRRRRDVLRYLDDCDGEVRLGDLAEQIAAWENDKEVRLITSSERKRVYVALYQCHLPSMGAKGAIDYNKSRGLIEKGEHYEQFNKYVGLDGESESESAEYHLALSIATLLGVAVSALINAAAVGLVAAVSALGFLLLAYR